MRIVFLANIDGEIFVVLEGQLVRLQRQPSLVADGAMAASAF